MTGANRGLGFDTARILAEYGARVILACRDLDSAASAADRIRFTAPDAEVECVHLDLMSLQSIHITAAALRDRCPRIDLLVNNAGSVSAAYIRGVDGFEATFATNHLGPFTLTGLLLDRIAPVPGVRIVTVSSITYRKARIIFDDLQSEHRRYRYMRTYGRAKLANLLFTFELQRRLSAAGAPALAVAAHPGSVRSDFGRNMDAFSRAFSERPLYWLFSWLQQPAAMGALATLRAAVGDDVQGGEFYGPTRFST